MAYLLAAVEHRAGRADGVVALHGAVPAVLQLKDVLRPDPGEQARRAGRDLEEREREGGFVNIRTWKLAVGCMNWCCCTAPTARSICFALIEEH